MTARRCEHITAVGSDIEPLAEFAGAVLHRIGTDPKIQVTAAARRDRDCRR
jgi:hypothetical protein